MRRMVNLGIVFGLIALMSWGISNILFKYASREHAPLTNLFYLVGFEVVFTIPLLFFIPLSPVSLGIVAFIVLTAILGFSGLFMYFRGLDTGSVSIVAPIAASSPAVTVLLALLFLNETLSGAQALSVLMIILGSIAVSIVVDKKRVKKPEKAVLYTAAAAVLWGVMAVLMAVILDSIHWFMYVVVGRTFGAIVLGGLIASRRFNFRTTRKGLIFSGIGSLFDFGGFVAFTIGLSQANASIVSPISMAFPAIVVVLAAILLKERMKWYQYISIGVIVAGLVLIST